MVSPVVRIMQNCGTLTRGIHGLRSPVAPLSAHPLVRARHWGSRQNEGMNMSDTTQHEYLFDAKLFTSLRITAPSERDARRTLSEILDGATVNCRSLECGSPLVGEASLDGYLELVEVDGEFCPGY